MNAKRSISMVSLIIAVCLCFSVFTACGILTDESTEAKTGEQTTTASVESTKDNGDGSIVETTVTGSENVTSESNVETEESAIASDANTEEGIATEEPTVEESTIQTTETHTGDTNETSQTEGSTDESAVLTTETDSETLGETASDTVSDTESETAIEETNEPVVKELLTFSEIEPGSYTLISVDWSATGIVDIPAEYNGLPVTAIGDYAFRGCYLIEGITIPDSITSIGHEAFINCSSLKSIVVPSSVQSIGFGAFTGCSSLESMVLPFVGSGNESGQSLERLFGYIFGSGSYQDMATIVPATLKEVEITGNMNIGIYAFRGCAYIESIILSGSIEIIDESAFYDCASINNLVLPESLTEIKIQAFYGCSSLSEVKIPDRVTTIGRYAFYKCASLLRVVIGANVQTIDREAFFACTKLVEVLNLSPYVNISAGGDDNGYVGYYAKHVYTSADEESKVAFVGDYGFFFDDADGQYYLLLYSGSSDKLTLPENVNGCEYNIYKSAFENNAKITHVDIPATVKSVGGWAFYNCSELGSVVLNEGLEHLGYAAFASCPKLTGVRIPSSIVNFEDDVFNSCDLMELNVFDNACYLGNELEPYMVLIRAVNTDITSCTIDPTTRYIGSNAFSGCANLKEIVIPDSVSVVGRYAFGSCSSLESVTVGSGVKAFGLQAFNNCYSIERVYVDDLSHWLEISFNQMEANPIRNIGEFYVNGQLVTKLIIPEGITKINPYAFIGYMGLVSVTIPEGVAEIGEEAFVGCVKLVEVYDLAGLGVCAGSEEYGSLAYNAIDVFTSTDAVSGITIGDDGFVAYVSGGSRYLLGYVGTLQEIVLPELIDGGTYEIYHDAFAYRGGIVSVVINNGAIRIGKEAFEKCHDLESVTINGGVEEICNMAFWGCNNLKSAVLANTVREIKDGAFQSSSLSEITIGMGVGSIGYAAFWNCPELTVVNYVGDEWSWGQISIGDENDTLTNISINYNYQNNQ